MLKRSKKHPNAHWRWWQITAASLFVSGVFLSIFALLPAYSLIAFWAGIGLLIATTIAAVWNWYTYSWWARLSVAFAWSLQFLAIAMRAWASVVPVTWVWLLPITGTYLLAWAFPAVKPDLSDFLWREQTAPQTRLGQAILRVSIALAPVAGVLGASMGMYGSRFGEFDLTLALGGSLMTIGAIVIAFSVSYHLWPERPWAKDNDKEKAEA